MIIALSGTPGTGKSAVAQLLAKKLQCRLISITRLVRSRKIPTQYDRMRKTRIVDTRLVQLAVDRELGHGASAVIEGHLAHLLRADRVVILRCNPAVLARRLTKKRWNAAKIRENVQAEILDAITIEALEMHGRRTVVEVDTSTNTAAQTAATAMKLLNNYNERKKHRAGAIDWSEQYKQMLIR
ncbi:MAG: AAA family ATPase [Candidatus Aenigmarchaeota archaeon]|nr:AAA family ATPase [Candidatus Aenigmarchaeota archaeon]